MSRLHILTLPAERSINDYYTQMNYVSSFLKLQNGKGALESVLRCLNLCDVRYYNTFANLNNEYIDLMSENYEKLSDLNSNIYFLDYNYFTRSFAQVEKDYQMNRISQKQKFNEEFALSKELAQAMIYSTNMTYVTLVENGLTGVNKKLESAVCEAYNLYGDNLNFAPRVYCNPKEK